MKRFLSWLMAAVLALILGLLLRQYVFTLNRVSGTSMEDTLHNGDVTLVTRFDRTFSRGDVVCCRLPNREDTYIKRIIGLPGEYVEILSGQTYIDGVVLQESYASTCQEDYSITLGEDQYLVLGDNRQESYDSRQADVGPVQKSDFLGRVRLVLWPLSRIHAISAGKGETYMALDQENNSQAESEVDSSQQQSESQQNSQEENATNQKPAPKKKGFWREVREWIVSLAVALLIVFVVRTFLFTIIRVDGNSMYSTLHDNERLFVTVLDVKLGHVDRDDVVICNYPNRYTTHLLGITTKTYFVKRVVAVPGDTIYRQNGVTYVEYLDESGEKVVESLDPQYAGRKVEDDYDPYTLGSDEYFVVGDNRYDSHDSRDWNDSSSTNDVGPITEDMIVGHVQEVIWPLTSIRTVQ